MDPYTLIITVFRQTDDAVKHILAGQRLRQAANLYWVGELVWQHLLKAVPHDPNLTIQDSKDAQGWVGYPENPKIWKILIQTTALQSSCHTLAFAVNQQQGNLPLQFAKLLAP